MNHFWFEGYLSSPVQLLAAASVAFACVLISTPFMIRIAHQRDWLAYPRFDRWHKQPTALMGGLPIFASVVISLVFAVPAVPWWIWVGGTIMFVTGVIDDRRDIPPMSKLLPQLVAAALPLLAGAAFGAGWPVWLSVSLTFFWMIGITNAVNLIDGMDGLAAGITTIAAAVMAVVAWRIGDVSTAAMALALAGGAGGFLVFNFNPARIFMGDGGSLFLGYMLAAIAVKLQGDLAPPDRILLPLIPIIILAVPIFDTTLVSVNRLLHGRRITDAGNDHTMHRLVHLGLSERRTVLTLYGMCGFLGGLALILHSIEVELLYSLLVFALAGLVVFGLYIGSLNVYDVGGDGAPVRTVTIHQKLSLMLVAVFGREWKAVFGVVADVVLLVGSFLMAHYLRFETNLTPGQLDIIVSALPILILIKIPIFYFAGLYRGIWRYAGTPELIRLASATLVGTVVSVLVLGAMYGLNSISKAVVVIDWMILTMAIGGMRLGFRALQQYVGLVRDRGRRALLYGAGRVGAIALREIRHEAGSGIRPVGFLDDDPLKQGQSMQGLDVLGNFSDLEAICKWHAIEEVIVTSSSVSRSRILEVYKECLRLGLSCRIFDVTFWDVPSNEITKELETHFAEGEIHWVN